uniref:Predicted protein n=1 Tax=Physcomitrium patens TaxID=3218 RepID=A9U752_PHYPA
MKIKDLETNDNAVRSYGYSTLNKFVQVGDGNLDGISLGYQKIFSTFEGGEDVLSNTLDYIKVFKAEPSKEMDYGSTQDYDHRGYMNSQHYDLRGSGIIHRHDDKSLIAYCYKITYGLDERSYEFSHNHYREDYEIV